jgi:hypothetical protein
MTSLILANFPLRHKYKRFSFVTWKENTRLREVTQRYQYICAVYRSTTKMRCWQLHNLTPNYCIAWPLEVHSIKPEHNHGYANFPHAEVKRIWLTIPNTREVLYPQKLALTSLTGGGRYVGIVRSRTKATEFSLVFLILKKSTSLHP